MQNRLNILFVTSWYPSQADPIFGTFVKEHAKAAAIYNNVTILSIGDKSPAVKGLSNVSVDIEDGIKTIRLTHKVFSIPKITPIISGLNTLRYMYKMKKSGYKPDVIHAHIYTAGAISVLFAKLNGLKVVVTEHWTGYARGLLNRLEIAKARFAFNNADMILPVSEDLQHNITKYGIKGKFKVVVNVIDTGLFKPAKDNRANNNSVKKILTVATQTRIKGIPELLEAVKQVKSIRNDFRLDIIGDGELETEYRQLAKSYELDDCVTFHGSQPKPIVARFMQESDFLLLPSLFENLPCVIIEAIASGIPVVASRVGGVPTLISNKTGMLIEPGNVEELVVAIGRMLDSVGSYSKSDLSEHARSKFSAEVVGKELDDIYREVLSY